MKPGPYKSPDHRRQRGQSMVEFALSLVMLLVLLAGVVDASRALFTYLSLRDAAQEGALYASINPSDTAGIIARTRDASDLLADMGANISVTVQPTVSGQLCAGQTGSVIHGVRVRINYPDYQLTMPLIGLLVGDGDNTISLSAEVQDMIIIPKCSS